MKTSAPVPHLIVKDGQAAVAFYEKTFGARLNEKHLADDGKRYMHAELSLGEGRLFLHDEFPEFGDHGSARLPASLGGVSNVIHLDVDDADILWDQALEAGAEVVFELDNQFWGMRYGQIRDPFGHVWSIGGPLK